MTTERRAQQRVRCFLSTSTPKGEVFIDELTSEGGRLAAGFSAEPGERLPLQVQEQGGGEFSVEIRIGRVWKSPTGYRMGWTFNADAASRTQAGRLFNLVSRPNLSAATESKGGFTRFRRNF
jgi:hypothetical protein